ncbi:MAG: competence/damage-inducible protein A [Armatimonadetes bacterium]|nr:competence/damage-inducible protein A [Armatimonadota bacterium]
MRAEIISVGTELLLGQIIDTNAPYLGRVLSTLGIDVYHRTTVGDNASRLADVLKTALSRADLVITVGGLGPTMDDLTKETIAEVLGEKLVLDLDSERAIREFFERRGIKLVASNFKQALKPESGTALPNSVGTAPGVLVEKEGKIVVALPGPPGELIPMVENYVVPYLERRLSGVRSVIESRVLKVCGIGESAAEEKVKDLLDSENPTIAPYAKSGEVHFRITAKAKDHETAVRMISGLEEEARKRLSDYVYGVDDETLESVTVHMLINRGLTLALAESCTGGLVSNRVTNVPGSSETFQGCVVAYSNRVKTELLGVSNEMIAKYGAVSSEVAQAMAEGAATRIGADVALGLTGIAGPSGGTAEKPVGLVYIGLKTPEGTEVTRNIFGGSREEIKLRASTAALNQLRMYLLKTP